MRKHLFIILLVLVGSLPVLADDNVEQMASTLGDGESPTVGTNLLLNIKPRAVTSSATFESPASAGSTGGTISIIGGQVKKGNASSSGGSVGAVAGAGISNFNSGRRSSVSEGGSAAVTGTDGAGGGPRKVGPGGGWADPGDQPPIGVGALPFAFMLIMAVGYGLKRKLKSEN